MRGSTFLHEFLSINDDKEFKTQRRLRDKEKEPTTVYDQQSSKGKVDCSGSADVWKFSYKMPEFITNYTAINKNIREASLALADQIDEVSHTVFQLSKYYEVLGTMYKDLEIKNMYRIHKVMSDVVTIYGNWFVEQGRIMKDKFSKFYTYHTHEDIPLRDLIK